MPRVAIALLCVAATAPSRPVEWHTDPSASRVTVHVFKRGLFSMFAHDHHFEVTDWSATLRMPHGRPSGASVEMLAAAGSLRDRQPALSPDDLERVNAQAAGPDVLDAARFPQIAFRARSFEESEQEGADHVRGTLHGILSARGREVPTSIHLDARRSDESWHVTGETALRQSALGIDPYSGYGGTVGVKDEVRIEISAVLRPADD